MKDLRPYQENAVKKICEFLQSDKRRAKIYISTGLGKTAIIVLAIETILHNGDDMSIVVLSSSRLECEQIESGLLSEVSDRRVASAVREFGEQKVLITTYQDILKNPVDLNIFSLVICNGAQFAKGKSYEIIFKNKYVKVLGILDNIEVSKGWFDEAVCIFSYTMKDAVKAGYDIHAGEKDFIQNFLISLLDYQGYKNIKEGFKKVDENSNFRADVIAEKEGVTAVFKVNVYRNLYNSKAIINNALKQILQYRQMITQKNKDQVPSFIIVLPCEIQNETQKEIFERFKVVIWDIRNLLYLCGGNRELYNLLLKSIPYPTLNLEAKKPIDMADGTVEFVPDTTIPSLAESFVSRLENCKAGRINKADKKYETLCTEIIKYLFDTEFFKISEQHKTDDEMFRMDLLCSLKGTTEFWKFLITYYHTKFVVFEYKNYSEYIPQNLIYITEKYLFPVALRNVAFIISRKGFDQNAAKAALGCLRENGKLIISLDDDDLIQMILMKDKGEEPSDYLLDKVEKLLMSVSK